MLEIRTNLGDLDVPLADLGMLPVVHPAGGLRRELRVRRLPDRREAQDQGREIEATVPVPLNAARDNPLWICVTTEDGFQAWSSPIFVFR